MSIKASLICGALSLLSAGVGSASLYAFTEGELTKASKGKSEISIIVGERLNVSLPAPVQIEQDLETGDVSALQHFCLSQNDTNNYSVQFVGRMADMMREWAQSEDPHPWAVMWDNISMASGDRAPILVSVNSQEDNLCKSSSTQVSLLINLRAVEWKELTSVLNGEDPTITILIDAE